MTMEKCGEKSENDEKIDLLLKDMLENTTIHGLPKISSSKRNAVKFLWFSVFIAAFVLFVLQLYGLIKEYNSNPKQTTITLQSGTVKFPAITLCNMNVVKQSKVVLQDQLSELNAEERSGFAEETGLSVAPEEYDIYGFILRGYTVVDEFQEMFYPHDTYWEMIDDLSGMYHHANPKPSDPSLKPKLISKNELLTIIGEPMLPSTTTTTTSTTPVTPITSTTSPTQNTTSNVKRRKREELATFRVPLRKSHEVRLFAYNYFKDILDKDEYRQPTVAWRTRKVLFEAILQQQSSSYKAHFMHIADRISSVLYEKLVTPSGKDPDIEGNLRVNLGHQFDDLLTSFQFAGVEENATYRSQWYKDYGNCYTIDSPRYQTQTSGPSHGFDLLLNLEMDEYISNVQDSQGVRIVLHEQGTVPFPNKEGITLAPGYEHQIGLKMVETSRLGPPYGICTDGKEFQEKYKIKYTRTTCTEICKIELYINECGCMPNDSSEILDSYVGRRLCKFSMDQSVKACADGIENRFKADGDICNCIDPCSATSYLKTISGRPWPTENYLTSVILDSMCDYDGRIQASMVKICHAHWNKKLDSQTYRNNFMKLQIYFEDTQYQLIAEEPTYGVVRFLSDIGGTAGLFIGASVLSIVEIVQVILEIGLYLRKRGRLSPEPDQHENISSVAQRPTNSKMTIIQPAPAITFQARR